MPVFDAARCARIASAIAPISDVRQAIPRHSAVRAPGRPAAKGPRAGAARCTKSEHLAGKRRAQVRSMDIPFTGRQHDKLRRDYDSHFLATGLLVLALA